MDFQKALHDAVALATPEYPLGPSLYKDTDGRLKEYASVSLLANEAGCMAYLALVLKQAPEQWQNIIKDRYAYPHNIPAVISFEDIDEVIPSDEIKTILLTLLDRVVIEFAIPRKKINEERMLARAKNISKLTQ